MPTLDPSDLQYETKASLIERIAAEGATVHRCGCGHEHVVAMEQ